VALFESGLGEALRTAGLPFADLNYEELAQVPNRGRASKLVDFHFPRSVVEADVIVSLPKMKTHHWVGLTGAMKNLYGVIPGIHYGWPKNVLHHQGIPQTVFDINASLPSKLAIVDGIVGGRRPDHGHRQADGFVGHWPDTPRGGRHAGPLDGTQPAPHPLLELGCGTPGNHRRALDRTTRRGLAAVGQPLRDSGPAASAGTPRLNRFPGGNAILARP
jgi:hypothetical protein